MTLCKYCSNWHNLIIDFYQTPEEAQKEQDQCECDCGIHKKENKK
jgi:hypothetical protein